MDHELKLIDFVEICEFYPTSMIHNNVGVVVLAYDVYFV